MNDLTTEENAPGRLSAPDGSRKQFRPLRAWPAFLLALLMLATRFGPGISEEGAAKYWMVAVFGPLLGCLLLLILRKCFAVLLIPGVIKSGWC